MKDDGMMLGAYEKVHGLMKKMDEINKAILTMNEVEFKTYILLVEMTHGQVLQEKKKELQGGDHETDQENVQVHENKGHLERVE